MIPLLVCVILLLAVPFRWEKGSQHTIGNRVRKTIIYKTDRWTGDKWVQIYTSSNSTIDSKFVPLVVGNMLSKGDPPRPTLSLSDRLDRLWFAKHPNSKEEAKIKAKEKDLIAKWKIQVVERHAKIKELKASYNSRRNIATGLWIALFVISLFTTGLLYLKESNRNLDTSIS